MPITSHWYNYDKSLIIDNTLKGSHDHRKQTFLKTTQHLVKPTEYQSLTSQENPKLKFTTSHENKKQIKSITETVKEHTPEVWLWHISRS